LRPPRFAFPFKREKGNQVNSAKETTLGNPRRFKAPMLPMVAGCRLGRKAPSASISGDAAPETILLQGKVEARN